jgi:peptide/nickel transport system permease protein
LLRYTLKRILIAIPTLLVISIAVFWAAREIASPVGQLSLNPRISPEDRQRFREALGLDKSEVEQYTNWLGNFLQGDLGESLISRRDVWDIIRPALGNTLVLVTFAASISLLVGITIGTVSAVKRGSFFDHTTTGFAFFGFSVPTFWMALMVQLFFGLYLANWLGITPPLLPTAGIYPPGHQGFDPILRTKFLLLPAFVLAVQLVAVYSRYMRASMLEVLNSDYIRTARSKGVGEKTVLVKHGVRTALIPVTTQFAVDIGALVGGLIITERIFQYPGMGNLFLEALFDGDYVLLLPAMMIVAWAVILANLAADLLYARLDPRIRFA